ncbi:hypothetical protein HGA13_17675 [Nocardia speluncae]|uniref:DNA-binding SARP family transcriptional activator n=1 Tax=Nocardia speluncae TaxID=419477 RepID=A0A846XJR7_9NOCA|nr:MULTISPECIES: BTAD domain-containing putative transcriptional regulator [Nocardia]NKY34886.1 hypothetical protein [Nocardia speluncae]
MTVLIALTGLTSRTGVTTTAVALADAWPGPQTAVVVEADPAGGSLAHLAGGDPHRGLVSLAEAATASRGSRITGRLWDHVQLLGRVPFLAAPDDPVAAAAILAAPAPAIPPPTGRGLADLVVIADCGALDPTSPSAPIIAGADAVLAVVRGDLADPASAGQRIRGTRCRRGAVLLIGSPDTDGFTDALGIPVLGQLPLDRRGASSVLAGDPPGWQERNSLTAAATGVAAALDTRLRPIPSTSTATSALRRWRGFPARFGRRVPGPRSGGPRVYPLHLPLNDYHRAEESPRSASRPEHDYGLEVAATRPPPAEPATLSAQSKISEAMVEAPSTNEPGMAAPPVTVEVFGPLRVRWHTETGAVDITARLTPRGRELLALLALHPEGLTREALVADLWGEQSPRRPANVVNTALARLTAALGAATEGSVSRAVIGDPLRYQLDPTVIATDYWRFADAVRQRRHAGTDTDRHTACRHIVDTASRGVLATDLTAAWVAPVREAARRDTITAVGFLAAAAVDHDPRHALHLLETALEHDPLNELLWRDILRLHARLGEHSAIEGTMNLLAQKLSEIGEQPTQQTRQLAENLRRKAPH